MTIAFITLIFELVAFCMTIVYIDWIEFFYKNKENLMVVHPKHQPALYATLLYIVWVIMI